MAKVEKLALVGLGYWGMPIAVAFAKKGINVIGFDLNKTKIDLYKSGVDPTKEVGDEAIGQQQWISHLMRSCCRKPDSSS